MWANHWHSRSLKLVLYLLASHVFCLEQTGTYSQLGSLFEYIKICYIVKP